MSFDFTVLEDRVNSLLRSEKLSKEVQYIDTLRFPTKHKVPGIQQALESLFAEVLETAEAFGVDLSETKGTFKVDNKNMRLYQPTIGELDGKATIQWGYSLYPLSNVLADDNAYVTIRETAKDQYTVVCDRNGKRGVLKIWLKKGKKLSKAQLQQKLTDKTGEQLGIVLEPVRVPTINLLTLRGYIGRALHPKSLKVTESKGYTFGALEFHEFPGVYYNANDTCIGKLLRSYMGDDRNEHAWGAGELEFTITGVKQGSTSEYPVYTVIPIANSDDDEDFSYSEKLESVKSVVNDNNDEDFEYEVE